uniref:Apple domain-containing protein n=1 Tax=Haemonchus placei TaxID=6290 RepID=A0A0N4W7D9_HAEPC
LLKLSYARVLRQTLYDDPTTVANGFRSEGGIIITIEYLQGTAKSDPMFKKLASPSYSLINFQNGKQLRAQELRQLLCRANCFCKRKWIPYTDKWSAPQGGCYLPVKISSKQVRFSTTTRIQLLRLSDTWALMWGIKGQKGKFGSLKMSNHNLLSKIAK